MKYLIQWMMVALAIGIIRLASKFGCYKYEYNEVLQQGDFDSDLITLRIYLRDHVIEWLKRGWDWLREKPGSEAEK